MPDWQVHFTISGLTLAASVLVLPALLLALICGLVGSTGGVVLAAPHAAQMPAPAIEGGGSQRPGPAQPSPTLGRGALLGS